MKRNGMRFDGMLGIALTSSRLNCATTLGALDGTGCIPTTGSANRWETG